MVSVFSTTRVYVAPAREGAHIVENPDHWSMPRHRTKERSVVDEAKGRVYRYYVARRYLCDYVEPMRATVIAEEFVVAGAGVSVVGMTARDKHGP